MPVDAHEYEQSRSLVAAVVPRGSGPGQLDMEARFSEPERRVMAPAVRYALLAAEEAVQQAGWAPVTEEQQVSGWRNHTRNMSETFCFSSLLKQLPVLSGLESLFCVCKEGTFS